MSCNAPALYRDHIWEGAAPANSSTNIFTTSIAPRTTNLVSVYRLTILLDTTSVVNMVMVAGGTTNIGSINGGTALTGGVLYTFDMPVVKPSLSPTNTLVTPTNIAYNFRLATVGTIPLFLVCEVMGAAL